MAAVAALLAVSVTPALAESVDTAKLMEPGPLPEMTMGDASAPVTIVEYASLTCPHCANFYTTTFPKLKSEYIDTGKVYFVLREFPLDRLALAAAVAARCAEPKDYFPIVDMLFTEQKEWAFVEKPGDAILTRLGPYGFTKEKLDECVGRRELIEGVAQVAQRGQEDFGVDGTPAFFVNGEKYPGGFGPEELDTIVQPLLDGAGKGTGGKDG